MRVLMTTDTVGGVWTYALELCRALEVEGVEVLLATMGPAPEKAQRRAAEAIGTVRLVESTYKLEWMENPWEDVRRAGEWLLKLERQYSPDLIHLNGYAHGDLPWRAPVMVVGHSCVLSWWRAVKGEDAAADWDVYREKVSRGIGAARLVVSPSHAMLHALREHYGPLPASRVIYNGRDGHLFKPLGKRPMIVSAGRLWDGAKNLRALESVAGTIDWPVYVAGDEMAPDGSSTAARNTRSLGRLTQQSLGSWLGKASIYALPAKYEPFGLSVLEAALSGCALVLGDIPSLREIWQDNAIYVSPDDHAAVRDALEELIHDSRRRHELSHAARQRAANFPTSRMSAAYLAVYHHLTHLTSSMSDHEHRYLGA